MFKQPGQIHASHILVKVEPTAAKKEKAKARKRIQKIEKKLKKGEDFGVLAKKYSEGPSATKGGDLGFFGRGQMVKPFEEAAFALSPGKVSGIVETKFGYHLIKVTDKKPATAIAFDKVKDKLKNDLKQKSIREKVDKYVKQLKDKAKVERFLK